MIGALHLQVALLPKAPEPPRTPSARLVEDLLAETMKAVQTLNLEHA